MKRILILLVAASMMLVASNAGATPVTLTLGPVGGALHAAPGATVGWGYTLENNGDNYAIITSADLCPGVVSSPCVNPLGLFTDFIAQFNFVVLDPHTSTSDIFNATGFRGIGSFTVDPGAAIGDSVQGNIVLTYDLYANGPGVDLLSTDNRVMSAASVTVSAVPEPPAWMLFSTGLVALGLGLRRPPFAG